MNCPKCNNEIDSKTKFCTKCGYNLEEFQKQEKEKKKAEKKEKYYKIKFKIALVLFIILIIAILVLIGLNVFGEKSHESKVEYSVLNQNENLNTIIEETNYGGIDLDSNELPEEDRTLDYDSDGLTNEEELQYGTSMRNSDTDNDGLSDYDEVKIYNSDPTKYSTSEDSISDYIKVERKLDINKKYTEDEIKPEEVKVSYNIQLIPEDINSQYYGGLEQFSNDQTVQSTYSVFNLLNFRGTVEYDTRDTESILLLREGTEYSEFENYKNEDGKLIITITEEDNYKDFVITTKTNYENYQNNK